MPVGLAVSDQHHQQQQQTGLPPVIYADDDYDGRQMTPASVAAATAYGVWIVQTFRRGNVGCNVCVRACVCVCVSFGFRRVSGFLYGFFLCLLIQGVCVVWAGGLVVMFASASASASACVSVYKLRIG